MKDYHLAKLSYPKPTEPLKPIVPKRDDFKLLFVATEDKVKISDGDTINLPVGCAVEFEVEYDWDDGNEYYFRIGRYANDKEIDAALEKEMKLYYRRLEEYHSKMGKYEKELAAWKEKTDELDKELVQKRLVEAEQLLRQHGRLK